MAVEREDLTLSLSLSSSNDTTSHRSLHVHQHLQLNLMPSLLSFSSSSSSSSSVSLVNFPFASAAPQRNPWNDSFGSAADQTLDRPRKAVGEGSSVAIAGKGELRSFLRGIDVNRQPTSAAEDDEAAGVSSPNSNISSLSGKRSEREATAGGNQDTDRACSWKIVDEEDGETSRKKLRLSKDQSTILEESFKEHNTLNPKQKVALAKRLGLRPRQVEVWFQNRRARTKLKQTEADYEWLKRCYERLTEENRRLQKEAEELRALKLSPQPYMQRAPPTTLTMCPSCEQRRRLPINPWGVAIGRVEPLHP